MPLPANNTAWPPKDLAPMRAKWDEWAAWYSNNTDDLAGVYQNTTRPRDGVLKAAAKAAARYFWGETRGDLTKAPERKLHVPVASDLCQASSDLLFSEAPEITLGDADTPDKTTAARLDQITGADLHSVLASGAEIAAALGGCYLRVTWDKDIADHPFLTVVDYDGALPTFRWGRLVGVTFWQTVRTDHQMVWRHLEHHETDASGTGVIYHGLYQGTVNNLGHPRPLTDHPATAGLADVVDAESKISTESPGLDVFHWRNVAPNRTWRNHALGKHLGRSDLDGIEPLLDALDEAYTSLMRDIRLGKAMLVVPAQMVESHGPGQGSSFAQHEIYSPVNAAPGSVADSKMNIEQVQFAIRITEHEQTILLLWNTIIRSAGYSAQTFGEGGDSAAMTATEVAAKERRSTLTQGRKARTVRPTLEAAVQKLLAVDKAIFGTSVDPALPVHVQLADGVKDDPRALAETAQMLATALAASVETRVRLVNPGRDKEWIDSEVERIMVENNMELVDPDTVGVDGGSLSARFEVEGEDAGTA